MYAKFAFRWEDIRELKEKPEASPTGIHRKLQKEEDRHLPPFGIGKLQVRFKQLDLLILDDVVEDLPVGQVRIRLSGVLKELPQRDA